MNDAPHMKTVIYFNRMFTEKDGLLYKHPDNKSKRKEGTPLGKSDGRGYLNLYIDGKFPKVHRIIYEMYHSPIPKGAYIDHIDGNRLNNRIENLRACTPSQNLWNSKPTTGRALPKNVYRCGKKFQAQIMINGKTACSKSFPTIEEANLAAIALREQHHGEFARHH